MTSAFATTPVGRAINTLSKGRYLQTPDQVPGWQIPSSLADKIAGLPSSSTTGSFTRAASQESKRDSIERLKDQTQSEKPTYDDLEASRAEHNKSDDLIQRATSQVLSDGANLTRAESIKKAESISRAISIPVAKESSSDDHIIVGWYDDQDPENPKNWTFGRKILVTLAICFLTFSVYGGSSIITPSIPGVMQEFNVSQTQATVTLSAFVFGYGFGPLVIAFWADIPKIGRSTPYWTSMLALVLFNVGAAHSKSYGTLVTMRLLSGMAGSPALATGGATLGDIWLDLQLPKAISVWAIGAVCGPVLAPVIAGWAAMNVGWRLPYWIFVAMSGVGLIITLFVLPETLPDNILYRRAKRLRALTGNQKLRGQGELNQLAMKPMDFLVEAIYMPIRISFEPIVLYSSVLLGLVYAIFYAAFEAIPIIFGEIHHFNLGEQTLPFLGLGVNAFFLTLPFYILYLVYYFDPRFIANIKKGIIRPEDRIILAMLTSPLVIISLVWTGWTSKASISYWSPLVALSLYLTPVFLLFQSILVYLSFSYVEHQNAVLTANDLIRSTIAAAFPLFSTAMFKQLGLGKAYTMLAGISLALMIPLYGLYKYGPKLRAMSKYAHNYEADIPAQ
ncbi:MFS general substrate transporter [Meira miltonrushii]|uniref:MFS general substrate transporter n=1 Tax=Meira miltonrushii TaxID=1280837 RepID=A0A316VGD0_9BASI|nr:MFS general substrate transporter [Meira miltonrushii]PWN34545.1 MFS general substrate transporter [Meira miltonrushii]